MDRLKKDNTKTQAPVCRSGRDPSAREMYERAMARYPRTMARLAE